MTTAASVTYVMEEPSVRGRLHQQIRAEFVEMPGLKVTLRQAARLWNLDVTTCASILRALVDEGFLRHSDRDAFHRADG